MRTLRYSLLIAGLCWLGATTACNSSETSKTESAPPGAKYSAPPDADNTARNANNTQPTAGSQAENEADRRITAAIRQSVVGDKSLSVNGHNVKIITADGVVTLRGPVKNDQEKTAIESKAKQVAGVTGVNNLLEVEKNP